MATVSYTLYSHYDPQKGNEPTPHESDVDCTADETWDFDSAFKPPPRPPPRFVPASLLPDDGAEHPAASSSKLAGTPTSGVSSWYRSLTSNRGNNQSNARSQPPPISHDHDKQASRPQSPEKKDKNNWFIMNAIRSNPERHPLGNTSSTTLADIIARDPPPLPNEQKFKPPVWLEIGPSNKGFAMLQRSGWSEGEPLGPDVVRQPTVASRSNMIELNTKEGRVKEERIEVKLAGYDDVAELRHVDVIDLTTSDSEDDDYASPPPEKEHDHPIKPSNDTHGRTALLVPIATVLKSDRLGIGLKAKTVGPYKASQRRVTHNSAALAAHVKAAEETRRKKKQYGRGKRGFDTQHRKEEANRKHLLAYMND